LHIKIFSFKSVGRDALRFCLSQMFFLSAAVFLFAVLIFTVNSLHLDYVRLPQLVYGKIHLVIFSEHVNQAMFYLSSMGILLFSASFLLKKSVVWTAICYAPLPASLISILLGLNELGQFFISLSCILCLFWIFIHPTSEFRHAFNATVAIANIFSYILIIFLSIELPSLLFWLSYPFLERASLPGFLMEASNLELQLFFSPKFSVSLLILFTLFAWTLTPLQIWLKRVKHLSIRFAGVELNPREAFSIDLNFSSFNFQGRGYLNPLLLFSSIFLCVAYIFYAYNRLLLGSGGYIGVDIRFYKEWLQNMRSGDIANALSYAFFNLSDRSLSLFILYISSMILNSPETVAQFSLFIIFPLIALSTYFFMRSAEFPEGISILASFFSSTSLLITIGVHAAFISNLMAWISILIASAMLLNSMRTNSRLACLISALTLTTALFMHVYTWSLMMLILLSYGLALFIGHIRGSHKAFNLKCIALILITNFSAEAFREFILSLGGFALKTAVSVAQSGLSLTAFWATFNTLSQTYYCSFLTNPLMLFLTAIGALTVVFDVWHRDFCLFMKFWIMAPSILFIFGNWVVQTRILYVLPLQVLAALGFIYIDCWVKQRFKGLSGKIFSTLLALTLITVNVNYVFRSMGVISTLEFT